MFGKVTSVWQDLFQGPLTAMVQACALGLATQTTATWDLKWRSSHVMKRGQWRFHVGAGRGTPVTSNLQGSRGIKSTWSSQLPVLVLGAAVGDHSEVLTGISLCHALTGFCMLNVRLFLSGP